VTARLRWAAVLTLAAFGLFAGPAKALDVRWVVPEDGPAHAHVEVIGLSPEAIRRLRSDTVDQESWQRLLAVYAGQTELVQDIALPAMLGEYRVEDSGICFVPGYPLEPGVTYRAVFRPAAVPGVPNTTSTPIACSFELPPADRRATTQVTAVYPSGDLLPENLLKFYLHFSGPMQRGGVYRHIHLRNEAGRDVELPFLELDEELWDPPMTRLTLFIDPGRIKRGVKPLEEVGPSLVSGRAYTLVIDQDLLDAQGRPLVRSFERAFRVGPPDRQAPDPARWDLVIPASGTRAPLAVGFGESLDHALALRMIRIADVTGQALAGSATLEEHDGTWHFVPDQPWLPGAYHLHVQTTIEDLAGNNVGKPFEVDLFENVQRSLTAEVVEREFTIH